MSGERIGAMVGSIGGLVFILVNAGGLADPAALVVRVLGAAAFAFTVWFAVVRPGRPERPAEPPTRAAMRVYWICVGAMAAAVPLGAAVINTVLDLPQITVCWVVLVVGAHFLPFAKAFDAPVFAPLGWNLVGLAVIGGALTLAVDERAAAWTAVLAGFVLLAFAVLGARTGGRIPSGRPSGSTGRPAARD